MSIEIPPTPATELEARALANQLAYGFEKHKDAYWASTYAQDKDYYWKRMLGWQAENGPDKAVYGLWAVPPTPWNYPATVPTPEPQPTPQPPANDIVDANEKLDAVLGLLKGIALILPSLATKQDIKDAREEFVTSAKNLAKTLPLGALGNLFKR